MSATASTPHLPNVVMLSLWRDDAAKHLEVRADHLLRKSYPALRWLWIVGDSSDDTADRLEALMDARPDKDIELLWGNTGITAEDPANRIARLAQTANVGLEQVRETDDYVLVHESDLLSPDDVVERFLSIGEPVCGGSVWLPVSDPPIWYDTWAYRKDGVMFTNQPPFHAAYDAHEPFEVDSVGSVYLFPAQDVRQGVRFNEWAVVGLMESLRERGRRIWCVPSVRIVQPVDLWVSREHA